MGRERARDLPLSLPSFSHARLSARPLAPSPPLPLSLTPSSYYRMLADGLDANGHGTHCAGSAVGAPLESAPKTARPWAGLAPASRLAFTDLGGGAAGDLAVPIDLSADYFSHHYSR